MSLVKRHIAALENTRRHKMEIGWLETARYTPDEERNRKGGTPIAKVARALDNGTATLPARPFFRKTIEEEAVNCKEIFDKLQPKVLNGTLTQDQVFRQIGLHLEGAVIEKIKGQDFVKLSEDYERWKRKFHKEPQILIDTGQMWQSLISRVVSK